MMLRSFLQMTLVSAFCFGMAACEKKQEQAKLGLNSEEFYQRYNKKIVEWLGEQKSKADKGNHGERKSSLGGH